MSERFDWEAIGAVLDVEDELAGLVPEDYGTGEFLQALFGKLPVGANQLRALERAGKPILAERHEYNIRYYKKQADDDRAEIPLIQAQILGWKNPTAEMIESLSHPDVCTASILAFDTGVGSVTPVQEPAPAWTPEKTSIAIERKRESLTQQLAATRESIKMYEDWAKEAQRKYESSIIDNGAERSGGASAHTGISQESGR